VSTPRYSKAWRVATARGTKFRVPGETVADRIRDWLNEGHSWTRIAAATGCSRRTLSGLVAGEHPTCNRDTARKILRARLGEADIPSYQPIDATGTRRRLQALMAIGHSLISIARELQHAVGALSKVVNGHYPMVRGTTARAVAALYRRWSARPGTCARSRARAATAGWPGPIAWGRDIDDPNVQAETDQAAHRLTA
jgi:AraC-like DNA-binding protein